MSSISQYEYDMIFKRDVNHCDVQYENSCDDIIIDRIYNKRALG